jgi:hypothetical protein
MTSSCEIVAREAENIELAGESPLCQSIDRGEVQLHVLVSSIANLFDVDLGRLIREEALRPIFLQAHLRQIDAELSDGKHSLPQLRVLEPIRRALSVVPSGGGSGGVCLLADCDAEKSPGDFGICSNKSVSARSKAIRV